MANGGLFGGLGNLEGLVKGFAGLMPQDKPEAQMLKTHTELDDLKRQEAEIFAEIGREAFVNDPSAWPQAVKLRVVQADIEEKEAKFKALEEERLAAERAQSAADEAGRCPSCGHKNPEGMKFCQACGMKLGASSCVSCGAELASGVRFCGACGARQPE